MEPIVGNPGSFAVQIKDTGVGWEGVRSGELGWACEVWGGGAEGGTRKGHSCGLVGRGTVSPSQGTGT